MKTRTKIWLGVGAFALAQVAGVSMNAGQPTLTIGQPAQAADGTCGWEINRHGRWNYDETCERGERYVSQRSQYNSPNYYERGERWNRHDNGWHRGWDRNGRYERGDRWQHGERGERWGERG